MTIYSVLRRIVRNDAIRVDPPQVYNWRVLALAASVRSLLYLQCGGVVSIIIRYAGGYSLT